MRRLGRLGGRLLREPLPWALALLIALVFGMGHMQALFSALFPGLDRPVYRQDSFLALLLAHIELVALSSLAAIVVGMGGGILVTRPVGQPFRPLLETLVGIAQTFPPVAVLAIAAPIIGFGERPALIALLLYGLLPIVHSTIAGLTAVPGAVVEAARGLGMSPLQLLLRIELPLAAEVILAGIRSAVVINIGTAAIAATVGAKSLGSPIIIGLNGFNTAYVLQGAVLVGLLAIVVDLGFDLPRRLATKPTRPRPPNSMA